MTQKAFVKLEKKLACDLRPGDLFVMDMPDLQFFTREMNGANPAISLYLRTNVSPDDFSDMDQVVYKVHVVIVDPEEPLPPKVDPHSPPGLH